MSYIAAVDSLYALGHELNPAAPRRKFDLAHMRALMSALGDPQRSFPSVLIAGTNGKGSTAATLASILIAAGYRTGLYTSPHLIRVNERIQIGGVPIPDDDFARLYFQVDDTANRLVANGALPHHPSFFEVLTAVAFLYFSGSPEMAGAPSSARTGASRNETKVGDTAQPPPHVISTEGPQGRSGETPVFSSEPPQTPGSPPVDIAILEVGLGGRLDATNIVDPLLSIITDIALDHQEYLGNTIAAITREKAGILRPNGILITLPQHPEANQAIGEAAATLNLTAINAAPFLPPARDMRGERDRDSHPERSAQHGAPEATPPPNHIISTEPAPETAPPTHVISPTAGISMGLQPHEPSLAPQGALAPELLAPNHYTLTLDNQPLTVHSALHGQHQQRNIALAITAAIALRNLNSYKSGPERNSKGYNISNSAIEAGIRNTRWPGRLELLPGAPPLLLDVAHNPAGAWTLRAAIAELPSAQPRTLIFSCLRDKSLKEMSQILLPLFDSASGDPDRARDHVILAPIANPRSAALDDLVAAAHALDVPALAAPGLSAALAEARALTPPDGIILATGSVYLVGEIRALALTPGAA